MLQLLRKRGLMQKIVIGSDHGGFNLKNCIINHLKNKNIDVNDCGCYDNSSCDYPVYAKKVAEMIIDSNNDIEKGILVCGTGIGMSIAANRYNGIRAAHCTDTFSARMSRQHNNSNILCLGERITGTGLALDIVDLWLETEFEGGRHKDRLDLI